MKPTALASVMAIAFILMPLAGLGQSSGINPADGKTGDTPAATNPERKKDGSEESAKRRMNPDAMFTKLDTDKDGKLSREEFMKMPSLRGGPRNKSGTSESPKDGATKKDDAKKDVKADTNGSGTGSTTKGGKPNVK